jgi:serine protease
MAGVFRVRCFTSSRFFIGLCAALGVAGLASAQSPVRQAPPVSGLIVKMKDAPSHERMSAMSAGGLREAQTSRVRHTLAGARMSEARARPVGRDAMHLDLGRRLPVAEAQAMAERLRSQPDVEWVELNEREHLLAVPNDVYYPYVSSNDTGQWWMRPPGETSGGWAASWGAPGLEGAWNVETGRPSAVVAVLDTGTTNHSDMNAHYLLGYDFVSDIAYSRDGNGRDTDPSDPGDWVSAAEASDPASEFYQCRTTSLWHGTAISGIIAALTNNTTGVAGVNWDGRVLPVRVAGKCGATLEDIVDGMRWAAGLSVCKTSDAQGNCVELVPANTTPARIINISFGGSATCGSLYQSTINELTGIGVVVVAAVGNEAGVLSRPASCTGVVAVGALARDGLKASYSNFGSGVTISTLGGDNYSNVDDGVLTLSNTGAESPDAETYKNEIGTSFSAPIVSGVISLMLSANPNLTVPQIIAGLRSTARPHVDSNLAVCSSTNTGACKCTTSTCGAGILDAEGAVRYAAAPTLPSGGGGDGGGGGALSWVWLVGLGLGVLALAALSRLARAGREGLAQ